MRPFCPITWQGSLGISVGVARVSSLAMNRDDVHDRRSGLAAEKRYIQIHRTPRKYVILARVEMSREVPNR